MYWNQEIDLVTEEFLHCLEQTIHELLQMYASRCYLKRFNPLQALTLTPKRNYLPKYNSPFVVPLIMSSTPPTNTIEIFSKLKYFTFILYYGRTMQFHSEVHAYFLCTWKTGLWSKNSHFIQTSNFQNLLGFSKCQQVKFI